MEDGNAWKELVSLAGKIPRERGKVPMESLLSSSGTVRRELSERRNIELCFMSSLSQSSLSLI